MESRTIKISLVKVVICLILIVTIVVVAIKLFKKKDINITQEAENQIITYEQNTVDEEKEYIVDVLINGNNEQITMKTCKGTFGYLMKYDVYQFYVEKNVDNKDEFKSLVSDTIYMSVEKKDESYDELKEKFISQEKEIGEEFYINGKKAFKLVSELSDKKYFEYYIENDNRYFIIIGNCGLNFQSNVMPIMEKMVESFEIFVEN